MYFRKSTGLAQVLTLALYFGTIGLASSEATVRHRVKHKPQHPVAHIARNNGVEVGAEYIGRASTASLTELPVRIAIPGSGQFGSDYIMSPVADPANPDSIYAVSSDLSTAARSRGLRILHSADGGKSFAAINLLGSSFYSAGSAGLYLHLSMTANAREIFISTTGGVFVSIDGGVSFARMPGSLASSVNDVKVSPDENSLLISYDQPKTIELYSREQNGFVLASHQPASLVDFIARNEATDPDCGSNMGCRYSASSPVYSLQFDPLVKGALYAGLGRGVYRYSPSEGNWSLLYRGVWNDSTIYNVDIVKQTGELFMSACNGIYHGIVSRLDGSEITSSNVVMTKVRSNSFVNQSSGAISPGYLRTFAVTVNESNPKQVVATASSGVYLSRDAGKSWQRVSGGDLPEKEANGRIYAEFRSAVWLVDGSVLVSGMEGTYRFKP